MAFTAGAPVPSWAVDAFRKAFIEGYLGNLKSWDDVFGRPPTKEELRRFNRDLGARGKIWQMIANARQQGRGITNDLFEEIGRKVGINKTDVGRLYKEQCRFLGTPEKP